MNQKGLVIGIIIAGIATIFIGIGGYLAWKRFSVIPVSPSSTRETPFIVTTSPQISDTASTILPTATVTPPATISWKTYTNTKYQFELKYPSRYEKNDFLGKGEWVSFILPVDYPRLNPLPTNEIDIQFTTSVLEKSQALSLSDFVRQYGSTTPQIDVTIAGESAKRLNFPNGLSEVYVPLDGKVLLLKRNSYGLTSKEFEEILLSVKLLK